MLNYTLLQEYLSDFPFIAITRGILPDEAKSHCEILFTAGFRVIENPLNSPDPYKSIELMATTFGESALIGAGTVITTEQVKRVRDAGGRVIISPNCDVEVIRKTKECGLLSIPGVATPTEAFAAIQAGADAIKLFPAEIINIAGLKALKAVLPNNTMMIPVGGIDPSNWFPYFEAGAVAFGLGSSLFKKDISSEELKEKARAFSISWQKYQQN